MKRSTGACTLDTGNHECRQVSIRSFFGTTTTTTKTTAAVASGKKRRVPTLSPTSSGSSSRPIRTKAESTPLLESLSGSGSNSFNNGSSSSSNRNKKISSSSTKTTTTTRLQQFQQMYLDLGQRDFASQQVCHICGMLYVHGVAEDLQQHAKICHIYKHGVPFGTVLFKAARVVATYENETTSTTTTSSSRNNSRSGSNNSGTTTTTSSSSIVEVRPSDSYSLRKKVEEVQNIVIQDLGFAHSSSSSLSGATKKSSQSSSTAAATTTMTPPRTVYLYIVNKRVVGLAVAQIIDRAYPVTTTPMRNDTTTTSSATRSSSSTTTTTTFSSSGYVRSSEPCKAVLGIYQLWVHVQFRQQGIATRLVTAAREKMVFGFVVPVEQTAFSSPTESGLAFAQRYMIKGSGVDSGTTTTAATTSVRVYDTEP